MDIPREGCFSDGSVDGDKPVLRVGLIGSLYTRPAVIPVRAAKALVSDSNNALFKLENLL